MSIEAEDFSNKNNKRYITEKQLNHMYKIPEYTGLSLF